MDGVNLILTDPASMPSPLEKLPDTEKLSSEAKEKFARDFESIFINKLLDIMQSSAGDWGFEKDGASQQINGIFSTYLADYAADNGGLGLAKEIYNFLDKEHTADPAVESLETTI